MNHLFWLPIAVVVGFLVPFLFGNNEAIPLDIYYLIYFISIILLFAIYSRQTGFDGKKAMSSNWVLGLTLGLLFAAIMAINVLSRPETEKLVGNTLLMGILWRGLVYGAIDGLFLSAFPRIVTWRAFSVGDRPVTEKIGFTLLAWIFMAILTTAYHLGFRDFRSDKIIQPNIGNTIMSLPTFISGNPIASAITHAGMHITAVIHSPQTELFLPPHR